MEPEKTLEPLFLLMLTVELDASEHCVTFVCKKFAKTKKAPTVKTVSA